MTFNSFEFVIFLILLFIFYWFVTNKNLVLQNCLLLVASYYFYACWDWRFLVLLFFISCLNYTLGIFINKSLFNHRKLWLIFGIFLNVGVLTYFKYLNFFIDGFIHLLSSIGLTLSKPTLNVVLPVGISFYIFLSLSYIIDIYQNKLKAETNIIQVLLTLSFFPIILAGPIQRPSSLLPQIKNKRIFNYTLATDGLRQILWGLFMKTVIADNCITHVNQIFENFNSYSASTLLLGGIFYTVQVYADFAGYSLMAIGISKLFGFELIRNFAYPYFARDITEFWKRWHISLTSWFRDYVFLPISYNVSRKIKTEKVWFIKTDIVIYIVGISITWLLTGLWHGGNYTFILWGSINGFFLIVYHILKKPRKRLFKNLRVKNNNIVIISIERLFTLCIIILSWIIFRSESIKDAINYISGIFSSSLFSKPSIFPIDFIIIIILFIIIEWITKEKIHPIEIKNRKKISLLLQPIVLSLIIWAIILWGAFDNKEFIYFQF